MPGACATPEDHPRSVAAPGADSAPWLAVSFHCCESMGRGREASRSEAVHGVFLADVEREGQLGHEHLAGLDEHRLLAGRQALVGVAESQVPHHLGHLVDVA